MHSSFFPLCKISKQLANQSCRSGVFSYQILATFFSIWVISTSKLHSEEEQRSIVMLIRQQVSVIRQTRSKSAEANEGVAHLSSDVTEVGGAFSTQTAPTTSKNTFATTHGAGEVDPFWIERPSETFFFSPKKRLLFSCFTSRHIRCVGVRRPSGATGSNQTEPQAVTPSSQRATAHKNLSTELSRSRSESASVCPRLALIAPGRLCLCCCCCCFFCRRRRRLTLHRRLCAPND